MNSTEQHYWVGAVEEGEQIFGPTYTIHMAMTPFAPSPFGGPRAADLPPAFREELRRWLDQAPRNEPAADSPAEYYGDAAYPYRAGVDALCSADIDWVSDSIKVMLCRQDYLPSDKHRTRSDVRRYEIMAPGYKRGGQALLAKRITTEDTPDGQLLVFRAGDLPWHGSTIDAKRAIVYKDSGDDRMSTLICCVIFDDAPDSERGTFTLKWSTAGILRLLPHPEAVAQ